MTVLTIIIPTIPGRESTLSRLLHQLDHQQDRRCQTLIINGPGLQGDKINWALQQAQGQLSVIIDDDDQLPADYVATICDEATNHRHPDPLDYIGYDITVTIDGTYHATHTHRADGDPTWHTQPWGPTPKCPFNTQTARTLHFHNDHLADRRWSRQLQPHLTTHTYIPRPLYHYDHHPTHSTYHNGTPHNIGHWPHNPNNHTWAHPPHTRTPPTGDTKPISPTHGHNAPGPDANNAQPNQTTSHH